jgi:chromosomal replication initiator protein DnaA
MKENIWDKAKEKGLISDSQFKEALEIQRNEGKELEVCLFEIGALDEERWFEFLTSEYGCRSLDLDELEIDEEAVRIIPARFANRLRIIPVRKARNTLAISMLNPLNSNTLKVISQITDYEILPFTSKKSQIDRTIEIYYAGEETKGRVFFPFIETMEGVPLLDEFTFENFITDKGNEFAYSLALAVAKSYNDNYNPLFIYGEVGLGKTHLLNAIGNYLRTNSTERGFCYTTAKKLVNRLLTAIQENTLKEFQDRYSSIDVLLLDDVEFLIGMERVQEEFFHIFDLLRHQKCQIVLTSDRPPERLTALMDRLTSRFASGVVTEVKAPGLEAKMAILRKWAGDMKLPDDVVEFIAKRRTNNIRALIGMLHKVITFAKYRDEEVTLVLAKEALGTGVKAKREKTAEEDITADG